MEIKKTIECTLTGTAKGIEGGKTEFTNSELKIKKIFITPLEVYGNIDF